MLDQGSAVLAACDDGVGPAEHRTCESLSRSELGRVDVLDDWAPEQASDSDGGGAGHDMRAEDHVGSAPEGFERSPGVQRRDRKMTPPACAYSDHPEFLIRGRTPLRRDGPT